MNQSDGRPIAGTSIVEQWDHIIRRESYARWRRFRPSSCDWRDVAQEVRLALLRRESRLRRAYRPRDFFTFVVRREAAHALRRLCREELGNGRVHIESDPLISELFYSSRSRRSDGGMD